MKPVMKTGRSEVKPPISLSSVLDFSSRSEEEGEDGWGKKARMKLLWNVYTVRVLFSEDDEGEDWVRRINCLE